MTPEAVTFALLLFSLRVTNYSISTIRLVFLSRGKRLITAVMSFFEALVFAVVMASIVADLTNVLNLLAYCMGAAVGSYVGMLIESRVVKTFATVQVITANGGAQLAERLRECGYGVTETMGRGRDGTVTIVRSSINTRDLSHMIQVIRDELPDAFIEVETANMVQRGFIPGMTPRMQ